MRINAKKKIVLVLSRLLDRYAIGDTHSSHLQIPTYDLLYDQKVTDDEVIEIFHNLKRHNLVSDWFETSDNYVLFLESNFLINAETHLSKIEGVDNLSADEGDFKIEILQGKIRLFSGKKSTLLSDKLSTKQARLIQSLIKPHFGIVRPISDVAESIEAKGTVNEQRKSIDGVFGEIQSKLNKINFPVRLALDYKSHSGSVLLIKKLGKD